MIVADTSALVAILLREPEATIFTERLLASDVCIAAPTLLELLIVTHSRRGPALAQDAELLVEKLSLRINAWEERHVALARQAFARFGKGRHPAKLNFGDCMSYALAKSLDAPLLYKGNDFALTDIRSAL